MPLSEIPSLKAWRATFSGFGVKPTQYGNAAEALLRRLTKQGDIAAINPLVDLANMVSIRWRMPVAVFDQAVATGLTTVRFAEVQEQFTDLGSNSPTNPEPGEVVFVDEAGIGQHTSVVLETERSKRRPCHHSRGVDHGRRPASRRRSRCCESHSGPARPSRGVPAKCSHPFGVALTRPGGISGLTVRGSCHIDDSGPVPHPDHDDLALLVPGVGFTMNRSLGDVEEIAGSRPRLSTRLQDRTPFAAHPRST